MVSLKRYPLPSIHRKNRKMREDKSRKMRDLAKMDAHSLEDIGKCSLKDDDLAFGDSYMNLKSNKDK